MRVIPGCPPRFLGLGLNSINVNGIIGCKDGHSSCFRKNEWIHSLRRKKLQGSVQKNDCG